MTCNWSRDLALALLVVVFASPARSAPLEVRSSSSRILESTPGQVVTTSVVVANRGAEPDEFIETITLPEGWVRVAPTEAPFRIEAGDQAVRVLALNVPDTASSGRYTIRYQAAGRRDPSARDSLDVAVAIASVDEMELKVEQRNDPVFAGEKYTFRAEVINRGNSPLAVSLGAKSSLSWPVSLDAPTFTLGAGESREVTGTVQTDEKLPRRGRHAVTLKASAATAGKKVLTSSRAAVAEIIPLISGDRDTWHRFPIRFSITSLMERGHDPQPQVELSGSGTLDEAGRNHLDFVLRGPDFEESSSLGLRDEYGLTLRGSGWQIDAGDRVFSLSPLTEKQTFGRGLGLTCRGDGFTAGTFYMRTRNRSENAEEVGVFSRKEMGKSFSVQLSGLRKWGGDSLRGLPQNIFSFEARYQPSEHLDLRLEYGRSYADNGVQDDGYRIEARGNFAKFQYVFEHAHAGPNFNGYYCDTDTTHLSLLRPITRQLQATASINRYAGNLSQNPERSAVVNQESSWDAGLRWAFTNQTNVSAEWRHRDREDVLLPAAYDFVEDSARIGVGHNFGKLQLRSFLDLGTLENDITGESGPFERYSVHASFQPTPRQRYAIYANYGPSSFTAANDRTLNLGFSAEFQFKENFSAAFSYARNQYDGLTGTEQDQVMARASYRFANGDELGVTGRWASMGVMDRDEHEAAIMLTYSRTFGVPVSRKTSVGALAGRLEVEGQPVPRAIIRSGEDYAVTDAEGHFAFASIKPGNRDLQVLADSLGSNLVATEVPSNVLVRGGATKRLNLRASRAGTVRVQARRFAFGRTGEFVPAEGMPSVFVELSSGAERVVEQVNGGGEAVFERLRPGPWKAKIASENLPPNTFIENPERELELKPGEPAVVDVRILPVKRKILMIDQGVVR